MKIRYGPNTWKLSRLFTIKIYHNVLMHCLSIPRYSDPINATGKWSMATQSFGIVIQSSVRDPIHNMMKNYKYDMSFNCNKQDMLPCKVVHGYTCWTLFTKHHGGDFYCHERKTSYIPGPTNLMNSYTVIYNYCTASRQDISLT
jgi:hypothetical protein